jgi:hypothetical protein
VAALAIAITGHTDAQVPQSMHLFASITHLPASPIDIAPTGHIAMQVWHPMQLFLFISYDIVGPWYK